ncbi:MAG: DUF447 family protein [Ignisphaera sp.]|nr:DUF447 family protein [Ignisphaera sp.]MDW8085836.1 DUF447 family protein [Ignisphaera sp.]
MRDVLRLVRRIGFSKTTYLEAIAVFTDGAGAVLNTVPLGFKLRDGYIVSRVFRGGRTFSIVVSGLARQGYICVTQNPKLFYLSLYEKDRAIQLLNTRRRGLCDARVEFSIEFTENHSSSVVIYLKPTAVAISRRIPRGFTRASASIIEALVWLTKIPYARGGRRKRIIEHVEHSLESVSRSSRSSVYRSIARKIREKMLELTKTG